MYAPGATLDPGCLPSDSTCGVSSGVAAGTTGQMPYYLASGSVLSATSSLMILANGNFGIGTTTPGGDLAVVNELGTGPGFLVGSAANATQFIIAASGNVGVGATSTPGSLLSIQGVANFTTGTTTFYGNGINIPANQCYAVNGVCLPTTAGIPSITQTYGTAQSVAITFATTTDSFNGLSYNQVITNSGGAFTFSNNVTGTLGVGGGGTGVGTFTSGQLLYGNGTNALTSVGTTTLTGNSGITLSAGNGYLVGGSNATIGLTAINANYVLANGTGASAAPTGIATSTFFGTPVQGTILAFLNGQNSWQSTTTMNIGGNAANITGIAGIANGGTGVAAFISGQLNFYNGTALVSASTTNVNNAGFYLGIGTTTPKWLLNLATSTAPQLTLGDGTNTTPWSFRSVGGNFYLATSSATTFATSTNASAFSIISGGISGLIGIGTTSPTATLGIQGSIGVSASQLYLAANGNVGIGTTSPSTNFSVQGNGLFSGTGFFGGAITATSTLNVTGLTTLGNASTTQIGSSGSAYFATASGSVGIGTTSPWANLSVGSSNATIIKPLFVVASSSAAVASSTLFIVNGNGNVGIGTTSPATTLEVGTSTAPNVTLDWYTTCGALTTNGNGLVQCSASDQRLKQNITPLGASSTLAALGALNPVSFYWKPDADRGTQQQYGFIAQQVAQIFPNLVSTTSPTALTPDGTLTLNYDGLIAPIIVAIQQLTAEVNGFAQSITTNILTAVTGNFTHVKTQDLCIGSTCITESQLQQLLQQNGQQTNSPPAADDSVSPPAPSDASSSPQDTVTTDTTSDTTSTTTSN